jgi:hypothetical protein
MNTYSLSGSERNRKTTMRTITSGVAAVLGTAALVATFTVAGGAAANAAEPQPSAAPPTSCWVDANTGRSLCVPEGVDLIAAVQAQTGVSIDLPAGTVIGDITVGSAKPSFGALSASASASTIALSALYDDINYGGGTYLMTGTACGQGIKNIGDFGWNDRASSFKSFSGCETAVYKDINYGSTRLGYDTKKASFGSMNDQASSWKTD